MELQAAVLVNLLSRLSLHCYNHVEFDGMYMKMLITCLVVITVVHVSPIHNNDMYVVSMSKTSSKNSK